MKKALEMMLLGMGAGIGLTKLYDGLKTGEMNKVINNGKKEINKVMNK